MAASLGLIILGVFLIIAVIYGVVVAISGGDFKGSIRLTARIVAVWVGAMVAIAAIFTAVALIGEGVQNL